MLALSLALSSSLCWGVCDFMGGIQARRVPLLRVLLVSQSTALVILLVFAALTGHGPPALHHLLPAAGAGLAGTLALGAFYRGLAIGTMSIVAPISATGAAVPVIVGVATGDRPGALQLVGIVAAVVGVVLASREAERDERHPAGRTSILLALVAALGFGTFFVGVRAAARTDVLWALIAGRIVGVAMLTLVCARLGALRTGPANRLPILALIGILDLSANGLYAIATRHGLLSVVAVAASLYPLATVLLARLVLGERISRLQEIGVGAALAGVAMIAAG